MGTTFGLFQHVGGRTSVSPNMWAAVGCVLRFLFGFWGVMGFVLGFVCVCLGIVFVVVFWVRVCVAVFGVGFGGLILMGPFLS